LLKKTSGSFGAEESHVAGNMTVSQNTGDGSVSPDGDFRFNGVSGMFDISNNRGDLVLLANGLNNLRIRNNRGAMTLGLDYVASDMDIRNNRGVIELAGEHIVGILNCQHNRPPVTLGDDNIVGRGKGECAVA